MSPRCNTCRNKKMELLKLGRHMFPPFGIRQQQYVCVTCGNLLTIDWDNVKRKEVAMREIRFRGFHNDEWVYGSYTHVTDMESGKPSIIPFGTNIFVDVEPESVGQFTGIWDNSTPPKEIYEGDIYRIKGFRVIMQDKYPIGPVPIEIPFDYVAVVKMDNPYSPIFDIGEGSPDIEVIGNVFQNPNLLEQNK